MADLTNRITKDEAALVRACASDGLHGEFVYANRIWAPIDHVPGSGKAKCRLCGETIAKDEMCILFSFDPYGGKDNWGRLNKAYLHIDCEGGTDGTHTDD